MIQLFNWHSAPAAFRSLFGRYHQATWAATVPADLRELWDKVAAVRLVGTHYDAAEGLWYLTGVAGSRQRPAADELAGAGLFGEASE